MKKSIRVWIGALGIASTLLFTSCEIIVLGAVIGLACMDRDIDDNYNRCGPDEDTEPEEIALDDVERKALGFIKAKGGKVIGNAEIGDSDEDEKGVFIEGRTVTLSAFKMSKYEVTQGEYSYVMNNQKITLGGKEYELSSSPSSCNGKNDHYGVDYRIKHTYHPVENVTWYDAVYYCNALSEMSGLDKCYEITIKNIINGHIVEADVTYNKIKKGYRLPTEAEWEYAARGGDPSGKTWDYTYSGADSIFDFDDFGWYDENNFGNYYKEKYEVKDDTYRFRGTHMVGEKDPNRLGLYDMSGNVAEWCYDRKGSINCETITNPSGPSVGDKRVVRGGNWKSSANDVSVSFRNGETPNDHSNGIGFRVCRSL